MSMKPLLPVYEAEVISEKSAEGLKDWLRRRSDWTPEKKGMAGSIAIAVAARTGVERRVRVS